MSVKRMPVWLLISGLLWGGAAYAHEGGHETAAEASAEADATYTEDEIVAAAKGFFGATTEGLAKVIEKVFGELGEPNAYIIGEEVSGAVGVGLRYGNGELRYKDGASQKVYWQGPSVGFDIGGNASKVFTLVYKLRTSTDLFKRYPGVEGSYYFIAGLGLNYLRSDPVTLAPIRTGVGLRAGANFGYMHFTREKTWNPL